MSEEVGGAFRATDRVAWGWALLTGGIGSCVSEIDARNQQESSGAGWSTLDALVWVPLDDVAVGRPAEA